MVKVNDLVKIELETNPNSIACDPYSCVVRVKHDYSIGWKTVGHVPREISMYIYFFVKQEEGTATGVKKSVNYKPSPIPSGGLEVPLLLTFSCPQKLFRDKMKEFIEDFYSFDFTGIHYDTDSFVR